VVVNYASPPPTWADYWVIYLADNMRLTPLNVEVSNPSMYMDRLVIRNLVLQSAIISFTLFQSENVNVVIYDVTCRFIKNLYNANLSEG
jgi:hypothetical protein